MKKSLSKEVIKKKSLYGLHERNILSERNNGNDITEKSITARK